MGWLQDTFARFGGGRPTAGRRDTSFYFSRGAAEFEAGEYAAAVEDLERALALARAGSDIALHEVHYLLGRAHTALGRLAPASMSFEAAVREKPDFAEALEQGARVLQELDAHDEAVGWLQRLVELRPTVASRVELGRQLRKSGRNAEAEELLRALCREVPRNVEAALLRHHVLVSLGRHEEALTEIERVLKICEPHPDLLVNRSVPLARMGRLDEAMGSIVKALKLDPRHARALANRASVLLGQLRVPEAIAAAREGLRLHPQDPDLHWSVGAGLLMLGDLDGGWAEAEWRTRATGHEGALPDLEQPRWTGEPLSGRTILLHAEQGFGDAIQFLRFVPEVASMAGSVLLLVWPELEPLMAGSLPANCRIVRRGAELPAFDFHCSLMSVPAVLKTPLEALSVAVPYLCPDPQAVQAWRERLGPDGLKVGLCWSGNPGHMNDRHRSIALKTLRSLAAPGCRFFTLQPKKRPGEEETLAAWTGAMDTGKDLRNFSDTAALIDALDLVVTVDTAVAHVAGALGKPVWLLLSRVPEWRWMLDRTDSPWYPSARLYRQVKLGDWAPVLKRVKADLAALAAAR